MRFFTIPIVIWKTRKVILARFFFLDQSLKGVGGHHFDYAAHILRAAESAGFDTFLGAHRRFREQRLLPRDCTIDPVFRHTIYNRYSDFAPKKTRGRETDSSRPQTWRAWWSKRSYERGRARMVQHFREDCANLFGHRAHQFGDQVFLATISDVELLGLAEYARHEPTSRLATWHCQFHFNIFQGRPHEYVHQSEALDQCRERFRQAIEALRDHRVYFYNTSEELADQYRRMGLAEFRSLAYPVNPRLSIARTPRRISAKHDSQRSPSAQRVQRPLRITLAGAVRREKGQTALDQLMRRVGPTLLQSRSAIMVIQRKRRSRFRRQQVDLSDVLKQVDVDVNQCVEYVEHPLANGDYETLMQQADIGLFLYDGRTYYARRAGILGEFLSLGVPVIVPAGCWLSNQIRRVNEQYHDKLIADNVAQRCRLANSLETQQLLPISSDVDLRMRVIVPPDCQALLVRAKVLPTHGEPSFMSCQLKSVTDNLMSNPATPTTWSKSDSNNPPQILGGKPNAGCCLSSSPDLLTSSAMMAVPNGSGNEIELEFRPAFAASAVDVQEIEVFAICQRDVPLGVVGLAAMTRDHVPALLEELHLHYRHYRETAVDFANQWYAAHDPKEVIRQLLHRSREQRKAA